MGPKGFEFVVRAEVDPKTLGAELRRLRESCQVSASDLAERMGWSPQNVLRLERGGGGREPTISSVNLYVRRLSFELVLAGRAKKPPRTRGSRAGTGDAGEEVPGDTSEDAA